MSLCSLKECSSWSSLLPPSRAQRRLPRSVPYVWWAKKNSWMAIGPFWEWVWSIRGRVGTFSHFWHLLSEKLEIQREIIKKKLWDGEAFIAKVRGALILGDLKFNQYCFWYLFGPYLRHAEVRAFLFLKGTYDVSQTISTFCVWFMMLELKLMQFAFAVYLSFVTTKLFKWLNVAKTKIFIRKYFWILAGDERAEGLAIVNTYVLQLVEK